MVSIQRLFRNKNRLHEDLEAAFKEIYQGTAILAAWLESDGGATIPSELMAIRHKQREIFINIRKDLVTASTAVMLAAGVFRAIGHRE